MAELYLYAQDSGSYEKGDVVDVLEDGTYGGSDAKMPSFFVVKVSGTKADLLYLKDSIAHMDGEELVIDKKRKYNCDYVSVLGQNRVDAILGSATWDVDTVSIDDINEKGVL